MSANKLQPVRTLSPLIWPLLAFGALSNVLLLTSPLFMMQLIDRVLPSGNQASLLLLGLIAAVAILTLSVIDAARQLVMSRAGLWLETSWTTRLLKGLKGEKTDTAEAAGDIAKVSTFVGGSSSIALLDLPWGPFFFFVAYLLHPLFAIVGLSAAAALLLLAVLSEVYNRQIQNEAGQRRRDAQGIALTLQRNAGLISTMGLRGNLLALHDRSLGKAQSSQDGAVARETWLKAIGKGIRGLVQIGTLGLGAALVLDNQLTGGGMIAASVMLARALAPVEQLTSIWRPLIDTRAALGRLNELAAELPEKSDSEGDITLPEPAGRLSVENVTLPSTPGNPPRLERVTFALESGTCLAILGPSGGGKSTLASLLAGSTSPTIGNVRLDGFDLERWPEDQRARLIGFLPQAPTLFPGTIAQNISRFAPQMDEAEIVRAATAAEVHSLIARLPKGYSTELGFETGPLSGGERQRIALARALYGGPRLLVLDEPNASLDQAGEHALMKALSNLKQSGSTIVMIAHRAGIMSIADKVLLLERGRVRDFGDKQTVLSRASVNQNQLELPRERERVVELEDWIELNFRRCTDAEISAKANLMAVEMFNIALQNEEAPDETVRFLLTFTEDGCALSLFDKSGAIAGQRIRQAQQTLEAGPENMFDLSENDLALAMLLNLADKVDQGESEMGHHLTAKLLLEPASDGPSSPAQQRVH